MAGKRETNLTNARKINECHRLLDALFGESLRSGWFGEIRLTVKVQDGIIQSDVKGAADRQIRVDVEEEKN